MRIEVLLSHFCFLRAELRYGVDSLSNHVGHLREAHLRRAGHQLAYVLNFLSLKLAEVSGDALKFVGIFPGLNLCENFISGFFSLGEFRGNLSKASVDFGVGR